MPIIASVVNWMCWNPEGMRSAVRLVDAEEKDTCCWHADEQNQVDVHPKVILNQQTRALRHKFAYTQRGDAVFCLP